MSHLKRRKENICLNCKTKLVGPYCHQCGQENIEPKETVWHLITHFLYDITHFDGKFFGTSKYLISRPGFLPKEYIAGRRASYLNPVQYYVFTSAIFFLIFFSLFSVKDLEFSSLNSRRINKDSLQVELAKVKLEALKEATTKEDSMAIMTGINIIEAIQAPLSPGTDSGSRKKGLTLGITKSRYKSRHEYDSLQKTLPFDKKDNRLKQLLTYRSIYLSNKYKDNDEQFWKDLLDKFIHTFPFLLFVSLPVFAFFLKLLYIRRHKFYYVDHGIFLIHLYIFTFILLMVFFGLMKINNVVNSGWIIFFQVLLILYGVYYAYKAMRKFYNQGRAKTILKFILLNILSFITIIILFSIFFLLTVFRV